jgi:hypothetical protein
MGLSGRLSQPPRRKQRSVARGGRKAGRHAGIKEAAARLAKEDGVSLNQWIASEVAEKVGTVQTAALFLKQRAGTAKPEDLLPLLNDAPDVPAEPDDC